MDKSDFYIAHGINRRLLFNENDKVIIEINDEKELNEEN